MATIIDSLIFDRTADDVERVKTLKDQIMTEGLDSLTASELEEYLAGMKGAYNASDMNRVGEAVSYLATRLVGMPDTLLAYMEEMGVGNDPLFDIPYDTAKVSVNPKTDWSVSDIPTQAQIKTYLANISNLRSILTLPSGTPTTPATLNGMTYVIANNLEQILWVIDQKLSEIEAELKALISRVPVGWMYSGEIWCGEV